MADFTVTRSWRGQRLNISWTNVNTLGPQVFTCGTCGESVSSNAGYYASGNPSGWRVYLCHHCGHPTFFDEKGSQAPGPLAGNKVGHLPPDVGHLYDEARSCCSVNAYTASILACRKLLMNIAVAKGAKPGLHFIEYVDYLAKKGFVPPGGEGWVDHIREKGNEATHEIAIKEQEEAEQLIAFAEMLLKFIFEFPGKLVKPVAEKAEE